MSPDPTPTKLCPTCGTRLAESATRCVVCGSEFSATPKTKARAERTVRGARMPELTLSLPVALGLLAIFLIVGAGALYLTLKGTGSLVVATAQPSPTDTATITLTPTITLPPTETPTLTPKPPFEYKVALNDNCYSIAQITGVQWTDIVTANSLNSGCTNLVVGMTVKVPYPTATPLPLPTATLEPAEATRQACQTVEIKVQANDTLSSIAFNYGVTMAAIKEWNGLSTDSVFLAQKLTIPLCKREPTAGPTPTPTNPPPYPAPNLLVPPDGEDYTLADDTVTLQWASIGVLRDNEAYQVTVLDLTGGTGRKLVEYVIDTKYIVPVTFRPQDNRTHSMRWWVVTVRRTGTDDQGNPIWGQAGSASDQRVFSWSGPLRVPTATP